MLSEERGLIATNQTLQSFWIEKFWTISDEFYDEKTHKRDRNKQLRYDYCSNLIQEEQMCSSGQWVLDRWVPPWSPWSHLAPLGPTLITLFPPRYHLGPTFITLVPPRYQLDILSAGKRLLQCLLIEYCTFYEKCQPTIGPTTLSFHFQFSLSSTTRWSPYNEDEETPATDDFTFTDYFTFIFTFCLSSTTRWRPDNEGKETPATDDFI